MKKIILIITSILILTFLLGSLYILNILPHKKYDAHHFNIETYKSNVDKDQDGIDDASDFLDGVRKYIATKPKYKSKYYGTGYPDDEYGVCTDVVNQGFVSAGYDIQKLINEDIVENPEAYAIETIDANIDFRRVKNLEVYLKRHAISLTTDLKEIESFQGGDIVVFKNHIGVISDKRNYKGIPFLIHHRGISQLHYEEDVLEQYSIIGHYRIS